MLKENLNPNAGAGPSSITWHDTTYLTLKLDSPNLTLNYILSTNSRQGGQREEGQSMIEEMLSSNSAFLDQRCGFKCCQKVPKRQKMYVDVGYRVTSLAKSAMASNTYIWRGFRGFCGFSGFALCPNDIFVRNWCSVFKTFPTSMVAILISNSHSFSHIVMGLIQKKRLK